MAENGDSSVYIDRDIFKEEIKLNGEIFQDVDWDTVYEHLVLHAVRRAGMYGLREGPNANLVLGTAPEDIALEVIEKTIRGVRHWDPAKIPLEPWLCRQVDSLMSHLFKSLACRSEGRSLEAAEDTHLIDQIVARSNTVLGATIDDPVEALLKAERAREAKARVDRLFAAVTDKPHLQAIMMAILDGCEPKPNAIASALGTPVQSIYNYLRQLKRLALKGVKDERAETAPDG